MFRQLILTHSIIIMCLIAGCNAPSTEPVDDASNNDTLPATQNDVDAFLKMLRHEVVRVPKIMDSLNIPKRKAHFSERLGLFPDTLRVDSLYAKFMWEPTLLTDTSTQYYLIPHIYYSQTVFSILRDGIKASYGERIYALSLIVHEACHYYHDLSLKEKQYARPEKNYKRYLLQPFEFDAFAVQAYYFIGEIKGKTYLDSLFTLTNDVERRKRILIDDFFRLTGQQSIDSLRH
jgi:hypothetical protein